MSVRDATKIKELAEEGSANTNRRNYVRISEIFAEIYKIADKMDARTGTTDPSQKKGWLKRLFGR